MDGIALYLAEGFVRGEDGAWRRRVPAARVKRVQDAIDRYFPITPAFFGASNSKNNETYRRFGLKQRTNEEMRADFMQRVTELVENDFGLKLPTLH